MTSETVTTVIVARGRSIMVDGRLYGPGESCEIPLADEPHIRSAGFVHDPTAFIPEITMPIPQAAENPTNIGLQRVIDR